MTLSSSLSSKRGFRLENHKRGRSLDSGLTIKVKDDDLVLFNDMRMRESENFLLNSSDDFDASLSKLKHISDYKLQIPVRGEGSDLLNAVSEKNDYDWLLTPPETPLFPSLDDDELQSARLVSRGRPLAQEITISTSNSMGKGRRTSRSSASPSRSTSSPQPNHKQLQGRGRLPSARSASPASVQRSKAPSRRSTTPQNRPSTPTPRSLTPTHRRTHSGSSSSTASFGRVVTSPLKANRGNSASPMRGRQMNFPDLSSEAPPNLQTSLSDWSASRGRDSSPSSWNGRKVPMKNRRESISPSASTSVSSSLSNERDHFSSLSKGSVTSSCDDDMDFTYPVRLGISARPMLRKNENIGKKPSRAVSTDFAPTGSFSPDTRQKDRSKAPHNKFRPLLSTAPPSSFHVTMPNAKHLSLFSWDSSLTTNSNASSDQGAIYAPRTKGNGHDQSDLAVEWDTIIPNAKVEDEILNFNEADSRKEEADHIAYRVEEEESDKRSAESIEVEVNGIDQQSYDIGAKQGGEHFPAVECKKKVDVCSKCDEAFQSFEKPDDKAAICPKCIERHRTHPQGSADISQNPAEKSSTSEPRDRSQLGGDGPRISETMGENFTEKLSKVVPDSKHFAREQPVYFDREEKLEQNVREYPKLQSFDENFLQSHMSGPHQGRVSEEASLSVVLETSGSSEGLVIQARALRAAKKKFCEEPSLIENCTSTLKSSEYPSLNVVLPGHSESTSCAEFSSVKNYVDSSKRSELPGQTESIVHSLPLMDDMNALQANVEEESSLGSLSSLSAGPGSLMDGREYFNLEQGNGDVPVHRNRNEANLHASSERVNCEPYGEPLLVTEGQGETLGEKTDLYGPDCPTGGPIISRSQRPGGGCEVVPSKVEELLATDAVNNEGRALTSQKGMSSQSCLSRAVKKHGTIKSSSYESTDAPVQRSSGLKDTVGSSCLQSAPPTTEKGNLLSGLESDDDKSTIIIHGPGGKNMSRSLTLEEAADSILFCSSIMQDLAFNAAATAKEKENSPSLSLSSRTTSTRAASNPPRTARSPQVSEGRKQVTRRDSRVESKCNCTVM